MCLKSPPKGSKTVIRYSILLGGLFYNGRDIGVMNVATIREKVVLYLEIKTAYIPVQKPVFRRKIGGSQQLMYRPIVFYFGRPLR
jgi:hypothetical protein